MVATDALQLNPGRGRSASQRWGLLVPTQSILVSHIVYSQLSNNTDPAIVTEWKAKARASPFCKVLEAVPGLSDSLSVVCRLFALNYLLLQVHLSAGIEIRILAQQIPTAKNQKYYARFSMNNVSRSTKRARVKDNGASLGESFFL